MTQPLTTPSQSADQPDKTTSGQASGTPRDVSDEVLAAVPQDGGRTSAFRARVDELAHIADLQPDPNNRRQHTPRNVGLIVDALHAVGAARSIVIDENNQVLAGNATLEAAAEAGIERVRIIEATGHDLVAVRRRGLTDDQKRHLALADNRAGDFSSWDVRQLQSDVDSGLDLGAFFEPAELADLLRDGAPVPEFEPEGEDEQGRLDQLQPKTTCPKCGHAF